MQGPDRQNFIICSTYFQLYPCRDVICTLIRLETVAGKLLHAGEAYGSADGSCCICWIIARRYKTERMTMPIMPSISDVIEIGMPGGTTTYTVYGIPSQRPCKTETKR